jgi:hypothetical protein
MTVITDWVLGCNDFYKLIMPMAARYVAYSYPQGALCKELIAESPFTIV